jgi:superkiller protein 3
VRRLFALGLVAVVATLATADTTAPPEARALLDKADLAREEGRLEEAAGLYRQAIEKHGLYHKAHAGFLAALRGLGDMAPAAALYSRVCGDHPNSVELKAFRAAALDPADAVDALKALAKNHDENLRVQMELARALNRIGDYRNAERAAKDALKIDADVPLARVLLGDAFFGREIYAKARKEYQQAVDKDPSYVPGQLRLAYALHKSGKSTDGLKVLARLLSDDNLPRLVAGHWILVYIRSDMGKYEEAAQTIDKILTIDKDDPDAIMAKGRLLLRGGKPMEAAKVFGKLIELRKNLSEAYFAQGWAYEKAADAPEIRKKPAERKERLVAAADAYTKCAEIDPGVRPRDSLGFVLLLGNEHADALMQFKRASDIDPKSATTQNNIGLSQDLADNRKVAKQRYEGVLKKIDKDNIRARVMMALSYYLDGSSAKAVKELNTVLKKAPNDDLAWTFLGDVHYDSRKYPKAISAYKKAVEINEKNFFAWYHLGICYDEKKKYEDADRCYRKALEANQSPPPKLLLDLAAINDDDILNNLKDALTFYQLYLELGGTEEWVPDRIKEIEEELKKGK